MGDFYNGFFAYMEEREKNFEYSSQTYNYNIANKRIGIVN